jgi:hypothetical protein
MHETSSVRIRAAGGSALIAVLAVSLAGCTPQLTVRPQLLSGSFRGETADGVPVAFTFDERSEAFRGEGTIDGRPVVAAGAVGWRGVGTLAGADGGTELIELSLAADGETVILERASGEVVTLGRIGPAPAPAAPGPFSGEYRASRDGAPLAAVTLVQSGELIAGSGIVAGEAAGVAGRATSPKAAEGVVTLADGSQTRFRAELAADARSLTLHGFGEPLVLTRGGSR